jgi:hypothetical protein
LSLSLSPILRGETDPKFYAVEVSAAVQAVPPEIRLSWPGDPNATAYTVYRKFPDESSWGAGTTIPGNATGHVDRDVAVGSVYEYQIIKSTGRGYEGHGYLCAGIQVPLVDSRGKVILVVAGTHALELAGELERLQEDLAGDGWIVLRRDVSPTDTPAKVKSIIRSDYTADPTNVKSVFLFGHVPVPYSGNFNPDAHPDHQGAWAADAYYGDIDGNWTDNSVNTTSAERPYNHNVPGDGKWDQNDLPSDVELEVGRVDLHNMTCFANKTPARSELDLLRQYLNKDHNFRHGRLPVARRGLVCDNFGERDGEAFAASGWRNFAPFFGADNVSAVAGWNYFPNVSAQGYLWSYGTGGGGWVTCDGIGSSDDFARTDIQSVFTLFLGSYFGDWDNESNFLRAPLGSTSYGLTAAWAGRPHWFLHHMALGATIGHSTRVSQNNGPGGLYSPRNYGTRQVHVALMGDPTLRMHPVLPPSGISVVPVSDGFELVWQASADTDVEGYQVYRSDSRFGPFTRLTGADPIQATTFTDRVAPANFTYMVRTVKLERSGSGTYYNASQGIFFTLNGSPPRGGGTPLATAPTDPASLIATTIGPAQIDLRWRDGSSNETGFKIERKFGASGIFEEVAQVGPDVTSWSSTGLQSATRYFFRVAAYNDVGASGYSAEASAMTAPLPNTAATARFVGTDATTKGSWAGLYGRNGYHMPARSSDPAYSRPGFIGASSWTWEEPSDDPRALQDAETGERSAGCWFAENSFTIELNVSDLQDHRVGVYFLDWDSTERTQTVEILDAASGAVLSSQSVSNFSQGTYLFWEIKGNAAIRISKAGGANAVLSGLFFDYPATSLVVGQPVISPDSGTFSAATTVTLVSPTPGATIRYTLDGTLPTSSSELYEKPFVLPKSTTVKARAFLDGTESSVASATFTVNVPWTGTAHARFIRIDSATQGNCRLVISGEPGQQFRIDASSDLVNWAEIGSVTLTTRESQFSDERAGEFRSRFYRAVLVP